MTDQQQITFENVTNPGQPILGGNRVRLSVPIDPGRNLHFHVASYPQPYDRIPFVGDFEEVDGACEFDLPDDQGGNAILPPDELMAWLYTKQNAKNPPLAIGRYTIGS